MLNRLFRSVFPIPIIALLAMRHAANAGILNSRLDHAIELATRYSDIPIIVSGKGRSEIVESEYMLGYLVGRNVRADSYYLLQYARKRF